nr:hypothetical protein [Tanacetum cinerariifolium]
MTRSLTKELFTPFEDLEREFRSSRKHFKTPTLDESRSPNFDIFSDQLEYSEEEVAKTMTETMEQYMSKTRADYGSRIARPKIEDKDTIQAQLINLGREIKKVNEKVYVAQAGYKQSDRTVKYPKGIAKNVLVGIGKFVFPVDFIILDMLEDIKVSLILERSFLSTTHAKIDVFKRKITLRFGEEKIIFKSIKPARSLIKRVYMLSLRERMELDLEARLMGETLVLNISLDLLFKDYIELNDLNVPLDLRRDQVDDLMPTIKEVLEDMDAYHDEGMVDVIFGEPFLREVGINAKRFEGMITIHNGLRKKYHLSIKNDMPP